MDYVRLDSSDNVVTATRAFTAHSKLEGISTTGPVPAGHKVATMAIAISSSRPTKGEMKLAPALAASSA